MHRVPVLSRIDRRDVSFGAPESACFYTVGVTDRYLRVYRSNPTISSVASSAESEDVDVCFGIQEHWKEKIENVLYDDLLDTERLFS